MESFPSFFFLLCKCGGHHLLCSPGAWPALSMSHVSMTSSGMKRGEQSGSLLSTPGPARGCRVSGRKHYGACVFSTVARVSVQAAVSYNTDQRKRGGLCTLLRTYLCLLTSSTVLFSGQPRTFDGLRSMCLQAGSSLTREPGKVAG